MDTGSTDSPAVSLPKCAVTPRFSASIPPTACTANTANTITAVESSRAAGIDNVSLDLIYAVPGETLAEWEADLHAAIALAPPHVSAYALTYEAGTPFHAWRAAHRLVPVPDDDEADMAERTVAMLGSAGYDRYEISSFARPGYTSRHNTAYWTASDYLGLGAGAHSFSQTPFPGRHWMNEKIPARYMATARDGPIATEDPLTEPQARESHDRADVKLNWLLSRSPTWRV